jgi:hypothetical protein
VDPDVIDAIRDGSIEVVAAVDGLGGSGVRLADGRRLEPDAASPNGSPRSWPAVDSASMAKRCE